MENVQARPRLHPLVAGAASAVILASAVAVAAIGGYLPGSKADTQPAVSKMQEKPVRVAAVCADCGTVLQVKEVDVLGKGTGVGAVAGGVAGAVIGHEIGDGSRAGTAVGAVVGGLAGHQIERSARSAKRYDVSVRMPDGSVKVVSTDAPTWRAGDKVRLHNGVLKPVQRG
jgi:outer membrane lipoprotein SlyB